VPEFVALALNNSFKVCVPPCESADCRLFAAALSLQQQLQGEAGAVLF
jgi:hypothetical protein